MNPVHMQNNRYAGKILYSSKYKSLLLHKTLNNCHVTLYSNELTCWKTQKLAKAQNYYFVISKNISWEVFPQILK